MAERTLEPTYKIAVRVWWAFTWRSALLIVLGALALGILVGLANIFIRADPASIVKLTSLMTPVIFCAAQIEALRRILRMDFSTYNVRILEKQQ